MRRDWRLRAHCLVGALTTVSMVLVACSSSPRDSPYGNPYVIYEEQLADAHYVFIAEVVSDGSTGEVVLSPVRVLKGDLPTDGDGTVRIPSDHAYRSCVGVWLLADDLTPIDLDEMHPLLGANPLPVLRTELLEVFPDERLANSYPSECEDGLG